MNELFEAQVAWVEVDLDAIASNVRAIKRHVGEQVQVFAVVKANAYGHGAREVASAALEAGADRLAVHRMVEGIELRKAGIAAPILIMGYTPPAGAGLLVDWRLTPAVTTVDSARAISGCAAGTGVVLPIHVKVDTGMSRYGLMPGEVEDFLTALMGLPGIRLEGLFTHFATADWVDQAFIRQQLKVFTGVISAARQAGFQVPLVHAANSAATMSLPEAHFNAVRPGIAIYGLQPSGEWQPPFELHAALTIKGKVARVHELPAGAGIGYGRTVVTTRPMQVALVPVGYGDGYHRVLSNKGLVLLHGQRAPVVGRVSMDQIIVDVSAIPDVEQDDVAVLLGKQGQEQITAEELAALAGTINYEVTTSLAPRLARVYIKGGRIGEIRTLSD